MSNENAGLVPDHGREPETAAVRQLENDGGLVRQYNRTDGLMTAKETADHYSDALHEARSQTEGAYNNFWLLRDHPAVDAQQALWRKELIQRALSWRGVRLLGRIGTWLSYAGRRSNNEDN